MIGDRHLIFVLAATLGIAAAAACRQGVAQGAAADPAAHAGHDTSATPGMQGMPGMPGMAPAPGAADGATTGDAGQGGLSAAAGVGADAAMAHQHMEMGRHMKMTAPRPRSAADRRRADALLRSLRSSIGRYRDVKAAIADGYVQFLPRLKQPMYHFTSWRNAVLAQVSFDPARPTSLLYKPTAGGGFELVGAMYTAPRRFDEAQLDQRVPLSVAAWHQHVNICMPPRTAYATSDWHRFGIAGSIADATECAASGGIFHPVVLGWMVHVYPFEQDSAKVWAH